MQIRRMNRDDITQVCAIENSTFSHPWSEESFLDAVNAEKDIYLVAEEEGSICGYCGLWGIAGEGQITNVAVSEQYRNKGYAGQLLCCLLQLGKEAGLYDFTLEVRVSNAPAIHLYHKLGFKDAGIRKDFYEKPKEDAIIMWLQDKQ